MTSLQTQNEQGAARVLALIPARGGSKGVPRKNARPLAGKPLVAYACECGLASRHVSRTMVSTDCPEIAALARAAGAEVPFLRPPSLAADDSPTRDVVRHALDFLRDDMGWQPDIVVLLQPTSPLRRAADVDMALEALLASGADSVVSVAPVPEHYHPEWQFQIDGEGELHLVTGRPVCDIITRRQLLSPTYIRNGAIYAFSRQAFEQTGSLYGASVVAHKMPAERSINIDSLADWAVAESVLSSESIRGEAA